MSNAQTHPCPTPETHPAGTKFSSADGRRGLEILGWDGNFVKVCTTVLCKHGGTRRDSGYYVPMHVYVWMAKHGGVRS